MKFKVTNFPNSWRSGFSHHKDTNRRPRAFRWNSILERFAEPCEESTPAIAYSTATSTLFQNAMRRCPSISMDSAIMEGQPCIAGTRIPVRAVLRALEQYGSIEKVRICYPHLTAAQVEDALYFTQVLLELPGGINETAVAVR